MDAPTFDRRERSWKRFHMKAEAYIYTCGLGQILELEIYTAVNRSKNASVFHFLYAVFVDRIASSQITCHDQTKDGLGV